MGQLPFRNVRDVLGLHAKVSSRKNVLIHYTDTLQRTEVNYLEFVGRSHQVANFLFEDLDIQRGERIALMTDNHPYTLLLYFSAWLVGASVVAVPFDADDSTIEHILTETRARVLFAKSTLIDDYAPFVAKIDTLDGIVQVGGEQRDGYLRFQDLAANRPTTFLGDGSGAKGADVPLTEGNARTASLKDLAIITYENGVFIQQSQYALLENAQKYTQLTALTGNQTTTSTLSVHQQFAVSIMATVLVGGTIVLNHDFNPDDLWQSIVRERVNVATISANQIEQLIINAHKHLTTGKTRYGSKIIQQDMKHFRHFYCFDRELTSELARQFEDLFGIPLQTGYIHPRTKNLVALMPITMSWQEHQAWLNEEGQISVGIILDESITIADDGALSTGDVGQMIPSKEGVFLILN